MLIKKPMTRRQILERLGGATAVSTLSPLVPTLEAAEADGSKKRFVYWHEFVMPAASIADSAFQKDFGALNFPGPYAPLNAVKDKVIFLRNLNKPQGQADGGGPHPAGAHGLSGWRNLGRTADKKLRINPKAHSMDQFLAEKLEGTTTYSDIRIGYRNSGKNGEMDRGSSIKNGKVQSRFQTPADLYDQMFAGVIKSAGGGESPTKAKNLRNKSVLDYMLNDVKRIEKEVSHFDKQRIESHLSSIRQTERGIDAQLNSNVECSVDAPRGTGGEDVIYPLYTDLMVQALNCDLTRVIGASYGSCTTNLAYKFIPGYKNTPFHGATHGNGGGADYMKGVLNFRAQEVTRLIKALDSVVEPDGNTLLDNSIFSWLTDVMRNHAASGEQHCIMAGGKGRFKGHGQMVKAGANDKYNQLLGSMAHYMGYEIEGHGDPNYGGKGILNSALFE